ncbi:MAG TPA: signal peptidase I [Polyangia bacterium]|nr:signal peptidase I [Polyangia bacterium]
MAIGVLDSWQQRRMKGRLRAEARHLIKEAQRILKRKSFRIPQSVVGEVQGSVNSLEASLEGDDLDQIRSGLSDLDQQLEDKLAFARKSTLREYSESIGIAVAIALLLRAFVVEAFQIPSGSMIPTLEVGDHIFVAKFSYGLVVPFSNKKIFEFSSPQRGDVIVFKYPQDPSIDYIKRVVALPGEKLELRHNELFINDKPMPRELVGPFAGGEDRDTELWHEQLGDRQHEALQDASRPPQNYGPFVVPAGNVFVMGDNRDNSSDSRVWGPVTHDLIKGKALIVWWSRAAIDDGPWYSRPVAWVKSIRFGRFFRGVN